MDTTRLRNSLSLVLASAVAMVTVLACGGGSASPTEPSDAGLTLRAATVSVDGTIYNGGTFHHGRGEGSATHFEADLRYPDGRPATGELTWVEYRHGNGMMGSGRFALYDDGTHGDPVAGDGVYCFDDAAGDYGFHHENGHHGEFHYDFWGQRHDGYQSNHVEVEVRVVD